MKKLFLALFTITLFANFSFAQKLTPNYAFCLIVGKQKGLSDKVIISLDYGDELGSEEAWLTDENGKVMRFNGMIHALNYMSAYGWEYVQAYTLSVGNNNVYHYLLRKPFTELRKEDQKQMIKELNDISN